jgi:hypothetical protein
MTVQSFDLKIGDSEEAVKNKSALFLKGAFDSKD